MEIVLLSIGGKLPGWVEEPSTDWQKKISKWIRFEHQHIKSIKLDRDSAPEKKASEAKTLLGLIKPQDFVLLCDEAGQTFDSVQFSKKMQSIFNGSLKRLVIVIGGAYGADDQIKKRAQLTLSFSKMTMNHHLAILVACEQVYRAITIIKNVKYHNE